MMMQEESLVIAGGMTDVEGGSIAMRSEITLDISGFQISHDKSGHPNLQITPQAISDIAKLTEGVDRTQVALKALKATTLNPTQIEKLNELVRQGARTTDVAAATNVETSSTLQSIDGYHAVVGQMKVNGQQLDMLLTEGSFNLSPREQIRYAKRFDYRMATRAENQGYLEALLAMESDKSINAAEAHALNTYRERYIRDTQGGIVVEGRLVNSYRESVAPIGKNAALFVRVSHKSLMPDGRTGDIGDALTTTLSEITVDFRGIQRSDECGHPSVQVTPEVRSDIAKLTMGVDRTQVALEALEEAISNEIEFVKRIALVKQVRCALAASANNSEAVAILKSVEGHQAVTGTITLSGQQLDTLLVEDGFDRGREAQICYAEGLGYRMATREEHLAYIEGLLAKEALRSINTAEAHALEFYRRYSVRDTQDDLKLSGRRIDSNRLWGQDAFPASALFVRASDESLMLACRRGVVGDESSAMLSEITFDFRGFQTSHDGSGCLTNGDIAPNLWPENEPPPTLAERIELQNRVFVPQQQQVILAVCKYPKLARLLARAVGMVYDDPKALTVFGNETLTEPPKPAPGVRGGLIAGRIDSQYDFFSLVFDRQQAEKLRKMQYDDAQRKVIRAVANFPWLAAVFAPLLEHPHLASVIVKALSWTDELYTELSRSSVKLPKAPEPLRESPTATPEGKFIKLRDSRYDHKPKTLRGMLESESCRLTREQTNLIALEYGGGILDQPRMPALWTQGVHLFLVEPSNGTVLQDIEVLLGEKAAKELVKESPSLKEALEKPLERTEVALFFESYGKKRTTSGNPDLRLMPELDSTQEEDFEAVGYEFASDAAATLLCARILKKAQSGEEMSASEGVLFIHLRDSDYLRTRSGGLFIDAGKLFWRYHYYYSDSGDGVFDNAAIDTVGALGSPRSPKKSDI